LKIVILDGYTENPGDLSWAGLEALGDLTVYDRTPFRDGDEEILRRAKGAEILLVNKTPVSGAVIDALSPELKYIGVLATGYNVIDTAAARAHGVLVSNIPTYATNSVAQMTMALLLELCHHVGDHSRAVKAGKWSRCEDFCFWDTPLIELAGKTFGIIGYGRIGQAVGKLAAAFGMRVLAYDEKAPAAPPAEKVDLPTLLRESDVVSLHCPLLPDTQHLLCDETIAQMKTGALVLNTSRGPLIDERALLAALQSGKLAGAGLDVLEVEPPREDNPLFKEPHCLVTPHISWAPKESRARLMDIAVENVRSFLEGHPQNLVNA